MYKDLLLYRNRLVFYIKQNDKKIQQKNTVQKTNYFLDSLHSLEFFLWYKHKIKPVPKTKLLQADSIEHMAFKFHNLERDTKCYNNGNIIYKSILIKSQNMKNTNQFIFPINEQKRTGNSYTVCRPKEAEYLFYLMNIYHNTNEED